MDIRSKSLMISAGTKQFLIVLLCTAGVLAVLFIDSFNPRLVLFSNDGPLGAQSAEAIQLPSAYHGVWHDLNSIGLHNGSFFPNITSALLWALGPLYTSKFYAPLTILILGLCAWTCFRLMKLSPLACVLGGLAAMLNSGCFSTSCWGVGTQSINVGMNYLAIGLLFDGTARRSWLRVALAGLAIGMAVMEGADVGAILSVFVGIYVVYRSLTAELPAPGRTERLWILVGGDVVLAGLLALAVIKGFSLIKIALLVAGAVAWNWMLLSPYPPARRLAQSGARLGLVVVCAVFLAVQAISVLFLTQVQGVAGARQDPKSRAERWSWATQWSLPKVEALGLFVPGLFGYRMVPPPADGSEYWGAIGRDSAWDAYFAGDQQGPVPRGQMRFSGGGAYEGVLVTLVAVWAAAQSFRRKDSAFPLSTRRFLWFWIAAGLIALLLSFGRFAPFYQLFYALPYASTIRNPTKFTMVFNWAIVILFAFGIHGLSQYLRAPAAKLAAQARGWWARAPRFDRLWVFGSVAAVGLAAVGWLVYSGSRAALEDYLTNLKGLEQMSRNMAPDVAANAAAAQAQAAFSISHAGWFVVLLAAAVVLVILTLRGTFSGSRAWLGGGLLGALLVLDLGVVDAHWISYWDYPKKYASNPIIDAFRQQPYERRVCLIPWWFPQVFQLPPETARAEQWLDQLYRIEWAQHHFQYYNVQSLDVVQMPRPPEDLTAFNGVVGFQFTQESLPLVRRAWELTNTKYILGSTNWLEVFNGLLDPERHRFRIAERFQIGLKPECPVFTGLEDLTATPSPNGGPYAIFELTSALPRARLYSNWKTSTNSPEVLLTWKTNLQQRSAPETRAALERLNPTDLATLKELTDPQFVPAETVLLARPIGAAPSTNAPGRSPGTVEYESYAPKHIRLKVQAESPAVLLLNDRYDPNWQVTVDGQPAELLRCNFIMRGAYVTPGTHLVEFRFRPPPTFLYISVAAVLLAILLAGYLMVSEHRAAKARERNGAPADRHALHEA